jgi:hypothetical protein
LHQTLKTVWFGFLLLLNSWLLVICITGLEFEQILDKASFVHENGFSYFCSLPAWFIFLPSDTSDFPEGSSLEILENGINLSPTHSLHQEIRDIGLGRFSHWTNGLYFSSSDNSNPITSGKVYAIRYRWVPPIILLLMTGALLGMELMGREPFMKRIVSPGILVMLGLITVIVPIELFLRSDYSKLHVFGAFGKLPDRLQPSLNSRGYRDEEHTIENPSRRLRILVLGDSLTFGDGVADHEIYPKLLSSMLGPRVEVISFARDGWSTADELSVFLNGGLEYQPEIVVVGVVSNDPSPPTTQPLGQQAQWAVFQTISSDLLLFRFLDYRINRLGDLYGFRYSYLDWEDDLYDPQKPYRGEWEKTVKEFSAVLRDHNIPGYAFILIGPAQVNTTPQKFEALSRTFSDAGFYAFNLRKAFLENFHDVDKKSLWALPDDPHPGPRVHEFYAREIWETLQPEVGRLLKRDRMTNGKMSEIGHVNFPAEVEPQN